MSYFTDHSINAILGGDGRLCSRTDYDSDDSNSRHEKYSEYYQFHDDKEYEHGKAIKGMNMFMNRFIQENMDIVQGLRAQSFKK